MSDTVIPSQGTVKQRSQIATIWIRFRRNRRAMLGLILLLIIVLLSVVGGSFIDYDTQVVRQNMSERLLGPSSAHPFGTDHYGRDMLARIIHGGRISLSMGVSIIIVAFGIGMIIGAVSGYFGQRTDNLIMRVMDIFIAIPYTLFAICIVSALGTGFANLLIAMTIGLAPRFSRVVRSTVLPLRSQEYIEAARACGTSHVRIIAKHVLPNAIPKKEQFIMKKKILMLIAVMMLSVEVSASSIVPKRNPEPMMMPISEIILSKEELNHNGLHGNVSKFAFADISLKEAYEKALPYVEDNMVIYTLGSDIGRLTDPENKYSANGESVGPVDLYSYGYTFRQFEDLHGAGQFGDNIEETISGDIDLFNRLGHEGKVRQTKSTLDAYRKQDNTKKVEPFILGTPIDSDYSGVTLENIAYYEGAMHFLIKYVKEPTGNSMKNEIGEAPYLRYLYNNKTGKYIQLDMWGMSGTSLDYNLIMYSSYVIEPEDLDNLTFCYDSKQFDKLFK